MEKLIKNFICENFNIRSEDLDVKIMSCVYKNKTAANIYLGGVLLVMIDFNTMWVTLTPREKQKVYDNIKDNNVYTLYELGL
jgi:hypothetical protein